MPEPAGSFAAEWHVQRLLDRLQRDPRGTSVTTGLSACRACSQPFELIERSHPDDEHHPRVIRHQQCLLDGGLPCAQRSSASSSSSFDVDRRAITTNTMSRRAALGLAPRQLRDHPSRYRNSTILRCTVDAETDNLLASWLAVRSALSCSSSINLRSRSVRGFGIAAAQRETQI